MPTIFQIDFRRQIVSHIHNAFSRLSCCSYTTDTRERHSWSESERVYTESTTSSCWTTVEHGLTDRRMTISVIVCCIVKSLKTSPLTTTRSQPVTIVPKKLPDKIWLREKQRRKKLNTIMKNMFGRSLRHGCQMTLMLLFAAFFGIAYVLYNGTVSVRLSLCLSQHGPTAANPLLIMRTVPRCQRT